MLSTLAPHRRDASRCTVASRFRCHSEECGIHCPRVPERSVTSPLCLVGCVCSLSPSNADSHAPVASRSQQSSNHDRSRNGDGWVGTEDAGTLAGAIVLKLVVSHAEMATVTAPPIGNFRAALEGGVVHGDDVAKPVAMPSTTTQNKPSLCAPMKTLWDTTSLASVSPFSAR